MKKFILLLMVFITCVSFAYADTVWVLCQPDSYVNIRPFANKKQEPIGYMECGWSAETTGKKKNGYICLETSTEHGYGWINKGYVVYSEPVIWTYKTNIVSNGRVACWRSISGNKRCWAKDGDVVTVYATSEEWAVTNKGFIRTKYLGVDYYVLFSRFMETATDVGEPEDLYFEDD